MWLLNFQTPTESEINCIYTHVQKTYRNKVIDRAWDGTIYVEKRFDQVRQHHSDSGVEILQQSMKIVLVPGDVLIVYIFTARISVFRGDSLSRSHFFTQ